MTNDELKGKFERLRCEFIVAQAAKGDPNKLARLVDELADTRRLIVGKLDLPSDEQTGDSQFLV